MQSNLRPHRTRSVYGVNLNRAILTRWLLRSLLALNTLLLVATAAHAQEDGPASDKKDESDLATGINAYDAGHFEEALGVFSEAYAVQPTPSRGIWTARALAKLGKLVESVERYHEITGLEVSSEDQEQIEAQKTAITERQAVLARIPRLTVEVEHAAPDEVIVEIDGAPSELGKELKLNPGRHSVVGTRGEEELIEVVSLTEAASRTVLLRFGEPAQPAKVAPPPHLPTPTQESSSSEVELDEQPGAAPPPPEPKPAQKASPPPPTPAELQRRVASEPIDSPRNSTTLRTWGWFGVGVGGSGLLLGGIAGAIMLSKRNDLENGGCVDGHCYRDQRSDVNRYNTLRTVSTIGFIAGGIALGGGILLLRASSPTQVAVGELRATIGPTSLAVKGAF